MQKVIIAGFALFLIIEGCSVKKAVQDPDKPSTLKPSSVVLGNAVENNMTNRDFYISKGKIITSGESGHIALFFTMKFKIPDVYLISLKSKTGIEAFRIYITGDTVLINDRINKTVLTGKTYDFERISGIPAELLKISVGDCFVNNPVINSKELCINDETRITDYYLGLILKTTLNCEIAKPKSVQITTGITDEYINIEYKKHRDDINKLPKIIEVYDFRRKIKIKISLNKYSAPWYGEIEFIPGSGYKIRPLL